MTRFNQMLAIAMLSSFGFNNVQAQNEISSEKTTFSIETDPSTFALNGYAIHVRIKPKTCDHILFGVGSYGLEMPSVMVDMNRNNQDKGWGVRINSAFSLFGEYYFSEANSKWFAGMQVGIQNFQLENEISIGKEAKYSNLLIMPSIGYQWRPFAFPLYIKPWMGIGYTTKVHGEAMIDSKEYKIAPLTPFATLHIGYTFSR